MKKLLILESTGQTTNDMKLTKSQDGYIFEGIFGEIGKKNRNRRTYSEEQYVPQIKRLQSEINGNRLLGELDHPKSFEVSLKNASHVIQELKYDPETKMVKGKIKLLDTSMGKEAKALVDAGVPLHISSRAAGNVDESGNVIIKELFTYDLVSKPGFENAQLNRINESLGIYDDDIDIYFIDESSDEDGKNKKVEDSNNNKETSKYINKENNITNKMDPKYVKEEEFISYTQDTKDYFNSLKSSIQELQNKFDELPKDSKSESLDESFVKIQEHSNELVDELNRIDERLEESVTHQDDIVDRVNLLKGYISEKVVPHLDGLTEYVKLATEKLDQNIEYSKEISKYTNYGLDYSQEVLAKKLDQQIEYSKLQTEKLNTVIEGYDRIVENVNELNNRNQMVAEYANELGDLLDKNINYSELAMRKNSENHAETQDMFEYVNNEFDKFKNLINESNEFSSSLKNKLNENVNNINENYETSINNRVNEALESAKKEKAELNNKETHFLRFFDNVKRNEFESLNESKKQEVIDAFKGKSYYSHNDVMAIYEDVFKPKVNTLDFINDMPEEYLEDWNNLTESQQNQIKSQAQYHVLNTQYQINNFWQTRDLRPKKVNMEKIDSNQINESKSTTVVNTYRSSVAEEMKKRFKR
jgi:hypothetical protein